jgi:hypothetical protein
MAVAAVGCSGSEVDLRLIDVSTGVHAPPPMDRSKKATHRFEIVWMRIVPQTDNSTERFGAPKDRLRHG